MGIAKSNIGFISKLFLAIALLVSLSGCGGGGSKAPVTFTFSVVNNSAFTVTEFYLSESTNPSWGPNRFTTSLPPGNTRVISGVSPCSVNFDFYGTNGAGVTWGPQFNALMPPCGGTFTLTLN